MIKRFYSKSTILFLLCIACLYPFIPQKGAGAQVSTTTGAVDTSRYLPNPEDFPQKGWQVNFEKLNVETRNFLSTSNRGYRMLVDIETAPRTAFTFNVNVMLVRPGSLIDQRRGIEVSNAHMLFQQFFDSATMGHYMPAKLSQYGDESFEAAKDYDKYRIFIRRGQYLIDIAGTDTLPDYPGKPTVQDIAHFFAYFVDSRIFGARIGIFKPIQVLDDMSVPLIAGKRMVIYGTIEVEKNTKMPADYQFTFQVKGAGFRQPSYGIPLGAKTKTIFGAAGDTNDGSLWNDEFGEPVPLTPDLKTYFGINDNPKYATYLYRFFIDPGKTDFAGNYTFIANIIDPAGSKLRERTIIMPTRPSGKLRIAIMPLPIGYWSEGKDWKVEDALWLRSLNDQAWRKDSYIGFMSNIPDDLKSKFTPKPIADLLRKKLPLSRGKMKYDEKVKSVREYLMGIMPIAEENFEIYVYDEFPEDLKIEPHPNDVKKICDVLEKWREKHPRFDRVLGVVPGDNPLKGGISFILDNDTGLQFWYRKKTFIVSVDAPVRQYAHDLAHTFGAIDEFLPPNSKPPFAPYAIAPINQPVGVENGNVIYNGYWPALNQFMGTPLRPINSIMGLKDPAWIPRDVYMGIMSQL